MIGHYIVYPRNDIEFHLVISGVISYIPVSTHRQEGLLSCTDIELKIGEVTW